MPMDYDYDEEYGGPPLHEMQFKGLMRDVEQRLEWMNHRATRFSYISAGYTGAFGLLLVVATFVTSMLNPGRLCGSEYVTTMIVGTILMVVGPLIFARERSEQTKLASNVLEKEIDLRRGSRGRK